MSRNLTEDELNNWRKVSKDYTEPQLVDQPLPTINDLIKMEDESNVGL